VWGGWGIDSARKKEKEKKLVNEYCHYEIAIKVGSNISTNYL